MYATSAVASHKKAITLFNDAAFMSDAGLAAFAKKMLVTLEDHKHMAEALIPEPPAPDTSPNP